MDKKLESICRFWPLGGGGDLFFFSCKKGADFPIMWIYEHLHDQHLNEPEIMHAEEK